MKHILITIITIITILALASCSLPADQKATLEANLIKDGSAALAGGLATGSWQGAAFGVGAQVVKNHLPVTSAKQFVGKVQP